MGAGPGCLNDARLQAARMELGCGLPEWSSTATGLEASMQRCRAWRRMSRMETEPDTHASWARRAQAGSGTQARLGTHESWTRHDTQAGLGAHASSARHAQAGISVRTSGHQRAQAGISVRANGYQRAHKQDPTCAQAEPLHAEGSDLSCDSINRLPRRRGCQPSVFPRISICKNSFT